MKNKIDLRDGLVKNENYEAFKFHGGEVHFKFVDKKAYKKILRSKKIDILTRVHNSDELMLLILVVDMLRKDEFKGKIRVKIPYLPYMQADRDFSEGETFSLKTLSRLMNAIEVDNWTIYDAHSDSSQMTSPNMKVVGSAAAIKDVLTKVDPTNLAIMSPDNGAYKRVKKIINTIEWEGDFFTANKDRNISSGNIDDISFNTEDFQGKDILIIDDICIGGRTFIELAKKIKECNPGKLYLYVSHGIFSHGPDQVLEYFDQIFTTDSRKESEKLNGYEDKITVFEVFNYLK